MDDEKDIRQLPPPDGSGRQVVEAGQVSPLPAPKKNKFRDLVLAGVVGGLLTACVGFGIYHFASTDKGYPVQDAQTVMQETTNPKLKAASTNKKNVYEISDASDSMNGLTVSVTGIQFRRDQTRLFVHLKNEGKANVSAMLASSAKLVDNEGHQYAADPFSSWSGSQIPVGMDETVMRVFDPIRDEAGQLTLMVSDLMNMKDPSWNVEVDFNIPE